MSAYTTLRPPWNSATGAGNLVGRLGEIGCFKHEGDRKLCEHILTRIVPYYEKDPRHYWFGLCWPGELCGTNLLENGITEVKLPANVKVTNGDFGISLMDTGRGGEPGHIASRVLPKPLDGFKSTSGHILVPLCSSNHWCMVIVQVQQNCPSGTVFLVILWDGLRSNAPHIARTASGICVKFLNDIGQMANGRYLKRTSF